MSSLEDVMIAYENLSFSDRIVFYSNISNDINVTEDTLQSFLIETRLDNENTCLYCSGIRVVKNGKRPDGVQRYLCRDCHKSFIPGSNSVTSGTRKRLSTWVKYVNCMMDKKTLKESSKECKISMSTAFTWRHKILDTVRELTDKVILDGIVEADETFFNVSFKGNHRKNHSFVMPRKAHKRGNSVHTKGLSDEKVCVPCAVNEKGVSFAKPVKLGKIDSDSVKRVFEGVIRNNSILCTDNEKAYLRFSTENDIQLIQTDTDRRITIHNGTSYGIQRINAYHKRLKGFVNRFNGVATKYLMNYIVWNDFLCCHRRERKEVMHQVMGQLLTCLKTVYSRDISHRPALPCIEGGACI